MDSTKNSAIFWSLAEKLAKKIVWFVFSVFLARLLTPEDFGTLAMATIFYSWVELFMDFGMGQAIIQKKNVTANEISTVFWINVIMGFVIFGLFYLIAPLISIFFHSDILTPIIRLTSVGFIIGAIGMVQNSLIVKQLNYKYLLYISLIGVVSYGGSGVILASHGYGVWSLVWAGLVSALVSNITVWFFSSWHPKFILKFRETWSMFRKGLQFMWFGLTNSVFDSLDVLLFSKVYTPDAVGHYNRAVSMRNLPIGLFIMPVTRPLFSIFAKYQDDPDEIRKTFFYYLEILEFAAFAVAGLVWLSSKEIIVILYTDKWLVSAEYLLFAIWLVPIEPNKVIITSLLKGLGKMKVLINLNFFERGIIVVALVVGYFYGIKAFMTAYLLLRMVTLLQRIYYVSKIVGLSMSDQLLALAKNIVVMLGAIIPLSFVSFDNLWLSMIIKSIGFIIIFIFLSHILQAEGYKIARAEFPRLMKLVRFKTT